MALKEDANRKINFRTFRDVFANAATGIPAHFF